MAITTEEQPIIFLDDISVRLRRVQGTIFKLIRSTQYKNVSLKAYAWWTPLVLLVSLVAEESTTANVMCGLQSPTPAMCTSREWMLPSTQSSSWRVVSVVFRTSSCS